MTDHELEQGLRIHYRQMDPGTAPGALNIRIDNALVRQDRGPAFFRRIVPIFGAALAAVVLVAVVLGLRPGGFLSSTGASGTPSISATPTVSPAPTPTSPPSPSTTLAPTFLIPGGSFPPVSPTAWGHLDLQALPNGPTAISSITVWSGGYIALGPPDGTSQLAAWISVDGRSWVLLPAGTFGRPAAALAAAAGSRVVVATQDANGFGTTWTSDDGRTWFSHASTGLRLARLDDLAGNTTGAVAVVGGGGGTLRTNGLAYSVDGIAWQTISLPGATGSVIEGVTAFGNGFVAVGYLDRPTASPLAWWSTDGTTWTASQVTAGAGDGFEAVAAGASGLLAQSTQPGLTPGLSSIWASADGRSWRATTSDPLGVATQGEGLGGANGLFVGDGTHLLIYGNRVDGGPTEYWTSLDGTNWTQLTLTGDTTTALAGQATPTVLRDGVLFAGPSGTWLGTASP